MVIKLACCVDLISIHGQIFLHAADESIADIGLVEIFDEVAKGKHGDEVAVEFVDEDAFSVGAAGLVVPDVGPPWWLVG